MKIVIDARLYSQSGVGRYLQKLIANLSRFDHQNQYVILLAKNDFDEFILPGENFEKRLIDIPWHSLREQLLLPVYINKEKPDLVHFPYFSVPLFYRGKFIITVHDLIIDHFDTGRASTRNLAVYKIKRLLYRLVIKSAIDRSVKVIAVSQSTKKEIMDHYHTDPDKITVTYEATDAHKGAAQRLIKDKYLLYVGNAYPHKNLERLLEVISNIQYPISNIGLVLVGRKDFFYRRLEKRFAKHTNIRFFGFADERQLINLYQHAQALIFPSLMEGFGLPGLEAMSVGTPVICSDILAFREIYQDAAAYFNPYDVQEMAKKIREVTGNKLTGNRLVNAGYKQAAKYSWAEMARKTLAVYNSYR